MKHKSKLRHTTARKDSPTPATAAFPIVAIGASAGGLEAFTELLQQIPADSGMAFVLIQHLDPTHQSYLTEVLRRTTGLPIQEIHDGLRVEPDHVYVIPSNADIGIIDGKLLLLPRPEEGRGLHLPIDLFFAALASDQGNRAIGVVLSGTGTDGSDGLRAIKAEDGICFAQEPQTAKFKGMPEAAVATGVVDFCLALPELAQEILRVGRHPFVRSQQPEPLTSPADDADLKRVFMLLRSMVGVDFSEYKPASILRRLARRMALHRLTSLADYVPLLRDNAVEARALRDDILIHVTSFFRDAEVYEQLKARVFPHLLEQKRDSGTIRIWSAGCATGEEAYSIVVTLLEFLAQENASEVPIQLFGTDISEKAIEVARSGFYSDNAVREMTTARLSRYFTKVEGGGYRINKSVRERCAFVKHDLASDPPFSKLDLVFCRNVLIYFGQDLQKRILSTFQFGLNQPGFLVLGHAESIADGGGLFSVVDKQHKIYARSTGKSSLPLAPGKDVFPVSQIAPERGTRAVTASDAIRRTESMLLDHYAPPGVIINERMEILHFRGRTGPYLEPAPGQPQHDLLKMARHGLMADLRIAISQAARSKGIVRRRGARIEVEGTTRLCDVVVMPVASPPEATESLFAVLFEPTQPPPPAADDSRLSAALPLDPNARADSERLAKVEDELKATKDYLHSVIGEHQRTNEELMTANEELVSSNEELQSLNEELETAKEELQSTNEELSTLNEELQTRNQELNSVNGDLVNILGSVEVPLVIVDAQRKIRRFTPKARPILNLLPTDVGRPIDDINPNLAIDEFDSKIKAVIDDVTMHEEQVQGREGRWYRLQIRPYLTIDKRIDGAVLSIVDIDVLKRALGAAEWSRDYARATVEAVQTPLLILDERLRVLSANEAFHETYGLRSAVATSESVYEFMGASLDTPALRAGLENVVRNNARFHKLEVEHEIPDLGKRSMSMSGRAVSTPSGERMVLLAVEDTTERLRREAEHAQLLLQATAAKASAEEANRSKDLFLATLSHELRTPLSTLLLTSQMMKLGNVDQARVQKAGAAIERASMAQAKLIDDLLDISSIVTGKLAIEKRPTQLAKIVQAAVSAVAPTAEKKGVQLDVQLERSMPRAFVDRMRLQQAFANLLVNAIKFTPPGGRVSVTLDQLHDRGRIRVVDTGIGIEPEFLPHVFDRFSQEDRQQTRTHGGLGLGLAITRSFVEAHGGSVEAQSPGKGLGSTFTVLLPLMSHQVQHVSEPPPGFHLAQPPEALTMKGVRVLVVEDDPDTREALMEILSMSGAEVRAAASAESAMSGFDAFRPELLICDIAMPGEDGYSLLARIRALGAAAGGNVPALALTALASEADKRRAVEAGFQAHVAKPVDIHHLTSALHTLLA